MNIALITGSSGLIGGEAVTFFATKFDMIIGIDNDMRRWLFGDEASTQWNRKRLLETIPNFKDYAVDIRDRSSLEKIFDEHRADIKLVVHTAAQPSHDWAANDPFADFEINANGTHNLLEMARKFCPEAVFIHCSTNKVYGDTPNSLPLVELGTRWELSPDHRYFEHGIDELMTIDQSKHSLFGASKAAADLLVQEYGRYFGMKTACFRGGCLTGPLHSGTELHGFLSYLVKCAIMGKAYTIYGYKGKQVRDNIHAYDLVNMFWHYYQAPRVGEVYNAGGGRFSNCSMLEAVALCEEIAGKKLQYTYSVKNRAGDHIWWISDTRKFMQHYPTWRYTYDMRDIIQEIFRGLTMRHEAIA